jgi:hypothetical protein
VDPFDVLPMPQEVADELRQIVHNLDRWEALPLRSLRALPSVRSWIPHSAKRKHYEGQPAMQRSNAAVHQRIEEAMTRTILQEDKDALGSLFTFDDLTLSLTVRYERAARHRGVEAESFRKETEKILLRELAGEMYRWELERALKRSQSAGQVDLDTAPSIAAQ